MTAPEPGVTTLPSGVRVVVHWTAQDYSETHEWEDGTVIFSRDGVLSEDDQERYARLAEEGHPYVR